LIKVAAGSCIDVQQYMQLYNVNTNLASRGADLGYRGEVLKHPPPKFYYVQVRKFLDAHFYAVTCMGTEKI